MDYDELVAKVIELLQRDKRVPYRALKRRFDLDDDYIEDLKDELIYAQKLAADEDERILVWLGETEGTPVPISQPAQISERPKAQKEPSTQIASPPPESHTPDAERRQLTILFTDLVDSTKLSGQLDAEDYREIVRAYQAVCAEVITRFECHLAQTLGDGLLVYSGYPVAHENDAERAVRTGLGILEAMTKLNERLEQEKGIRLGVRVGIHTGPVVVGDVGAGERQEQLALGEVPNVAARIQGLAEPNTVVISDTTYRLIQGYFDCETLGERELRGVADPIVVYRVLHESGVQSRLDVASIRGLTPLVGREQEVELLLDRWGQAKDRQGQVILLSGEAGIGKSRLVQVLKDQVANEAHTRLECRSSPYYQNTALYPITDLLQRKLQFQPDDTPEEKLDKLERELRQYRLPLEKSVPLFAPLLSLPIPEDRYPPLTLSPQRQRQETLETIVAMLLEQAEHQPVLFILEDLHWTDPTTLEFLELLLSQTPTTRMLMLLTCRPEFQPTWSHRSYLTEMTVNRLSHDQVARLTEQVAGDKSLPDDLLQQIVEKTDGVPLFVEEMTKAVLESGLLKEANGHYELVGSITSLAIPATLQDSLMARLDRLVTAKAIAQYAAVIGRQFSYELLQAASQLDSSILQQELGRLVEAELIYQRGLPPQATYIFKHALIQDIAYESLLRSTRQGYHRRIAEVLEEQFPETAENQPELVAHHYTEAGLNEQAVEYWRQASERAVQHSAHAEATYHLTRGLEVLAALPNSPIRTQLELTLQLTLGAVLLATKGYAAPEVEQTYAHAYKLCQHVGDSAQRAQVLLGLRNFYQLRADVNTAYELGQEVLNLATTQSDTALLIQAHHALAHTLHSQGNFRPAREHAEQSLAQYNPHQHQAWAFLSGTGDLRVSSLATLSWILGPLGYIDQAVQRINEAIDIASHLNHPFSLATALAFATWVYRQRREPHRVHEPAEALMALATKHGFAFQWARGVFIQGWARAMQGEAMEGIAQMHNGMAAMQETGTAMGHSAWLTALAEAYIQLDRLDEAYRFVTEALVLTEKYDLRHGESNLHCLMGEILIQQHGRTNGEEASEHICKALTIARSQEAKLLELRAATSLARLWQSQGKRDEARELLEPVYSWFTEGFDTADLKDARSLLDELASTAKR